MNLNAPVLFLVFNRPDTTRRVFEAIRQAKPARLFVAADGPRDGRLEDAEKCEQVRKIIDTVDWECVVTTLYRDKNLGCRDAVSSAIDWFFSCVEEGVILEDDCVPSQSFFGYCQELLERYRDDDRVMHISGANFLGTGTEESYLFSKYGPVWGWATWRRAWSFYDLSMSLWPMVKKRRLHLDFCFNEKEVFMRESIFDEVYAGKIDTWDYQWVFARLINSGLSIIPSHNLVTNIGFAEDATHTQNVRDRRNGLEILEIELPLKHPQILVKNQEYDREYCRQFIGGPEEEVGIVQRILKRLVSR